MFKVRWTEGSESGFKDIRTAQRFIDKVAKVAAPNTDCDALYS